MKKVIILMLIGVLFTLSGCNGIDKNEHQKVIDEKNQLELTLETLKKENGELAKEINSLKEGNKQIQQLKSDKQKLQTALSETYDAYRHFLVFVTTETYGNSLSKGELETYITKKMKIPTYDEVSILINN